MATEGRIRQAPTQRNPYLQLREGGEERFSSLERLLLTQLTEKSLQHPFLADPHNS